MDVLDVTTQFFFNLVVHSSRERIMILTMCREIKSIKGVGAALMGNLNFAYTD